MFICLYLRTYVQTVGSHVILRFRLGTKTAHSTPSLISFSLTFLSFRHDSPTFFPFSPSLCQTLCLVFLFFSRIIFLYIKYHKIAQHTHRTEIYIPTCFIDSWYAADLLTCPFFYLLYDISLCIYSQYTALKIFIFYFSSLF